MPKKIDINNSLILIIDIQDKLANMLSSDKVSKNAETLAKIAKILDIETIITEQYPKGLGKTLGCIKSNISLKTKIIEKNNFSAFKDIKDGLSSKNKKQILLCGIEAHICVLQTALDLIKAGYEVFIIKDITGSRDEEEKIVALDRLKQNGATITTLEIALFELLQSSKHPNFKELQALIK